jgi:hypothetical protein
VQGPNMEKIIDAVASGLKTFGDYVGSDKFTNDMRDFSAAISQLAKEAVAALRYFGLIPGVNMAPLAQISEDQALGRSGHAGAVGFGGKIAADLAKQRAVDWTAKGYFAPSKIHGYIQAAATKYGLPVDLLDRQAMTESAYGRNLVSPMGALGVMQLMPKTAAGLGVQYPMNPEQNVMGGALYDKQLLDYYHGDQTKAIAAYNWGMKNVDNAVNKYGAAWLDHAPNETQGYVSQILGAGKSKTDARVSQALGASGSSDVADLLGKLHSALSKPILTPKITVQNNSSANVAVQMNGAPR